MHRDATVCHVLRCRVSSFASFYRTPRGFVFNYTILGMLSVHDVYRIFSNIAVLVFATFSVCVASGIKWENICILFVSFYI